MRSPTETSLFCFDKKILTAAIAGALFSGLGFSAASHANQIEEVSVTAQKREQSVNDIGVSASAFGGEQMENLGIDSAVDLGAHTPGLVTVNSTSGGTPIFAIRGIGLDDFSPNNSSGVGIYTDEVFASNPAFLGGQLFDIERVEVLKGPQGTLYGKNTTGGAINFITRKPTSEFEAYVDAGIGNYNARELTGVVSGEVAGEVLGRVSVQMSKADGWQEDVETGREFGGTDRAAARGQLIFPFAGNGEAIAKVYFTSDKSTPVSPQVSGLAESFGDPSFAALNSAEDVTRVSVGNLDVGRDESGHGASLNLSYGFENFDFVSISAVDSYEREVVDNYGGSAAAILDLYQDNNISQWSQEFRVISTGDGPVTWIAGINISEDEVDVTDRFDDSFFVTDSVASTFVLNPADVPVQGWDLLTASYEQVTKSYGAYLHTETALNDSLNLIAGVRYSSDKRSFDGISTNHDDVYSFNDTVAELHDSSSESALTGKLGLDWQLNDDLLLYANVANSYKGGAYYGAAILDDVSWAYVEPEQVMSYEAGFKATLFDASLQLNGAVFSLDYTDRQSLVTIIVDDFSNYLQFPVADTTLVNVPESKTQGFELDMQWLPTDNLTLMAGLAYLDSEVTRAPTTAGMRGIQADPSVNGMADGVSQPFVDALAAPLPAGAALSQSPEWSYNGLAAYDLAIGNDLNLRLQTSYSHSDEMTAQLADANALSGPVSSWDAEAALSDAAEQWRFSAWVKNIGDEDGETYAFSSFAGRSFYRQMPTTYGVSVKYSFY
ncbi:TonB-dependent receptor [Microbulbifer marinus]|uniref:Iron complex outermembrane recepter protein n=1 Tax=Microbulbifer marinus TaxID=658218 RepID=A0A1H3X1B4_9GAMM|nr:TonB-dependent receptor [Microbulbifer marinus]SDZ93043.1 iron complex outermembrane recepter protein [Microbulbifer marinus]